MFTHATERKFPLDIKSQFDKTFCLYLCVQFSGFVQVLENLESLGNFFDIFQDFPVLEKDYSSWNVLKICLTQAIKFSEFMPVMYLDLWENLV